MYNFKVSTDALKFDPPVVPRYAFAGAASATFGVSPLRYTATPWLFRDSAKDLMASSSIGLYSEIATCEKAEARFRKLVSDQHPIILLSIETSRTTALYNVGLDPAVPAPYLASQYLSRELYEDGRLPCPWCGMCEPVRLVPLRDDPSAAADPPPLYARLVHEGCAVCVPGGGKIEVR